MKRYNSDECPLYIRSQLDAWAAEGRPGGGFLEAVLTNRLSEALLRGEEENLDALPAIMAYVSNRLPAQCWGTVDAYKAWLNGGEVYRKQFRNQPLKKFVVHVRETHTQDYSVMALSEKNAINLVDDGDGEVVEWAMEYSHRNDKTTWAAEEVK